MKVQKICQEDDVKKSGMVERFSGLAKVIGNMIFGIMFLVIILLLFSLAYVKASGGLPQIAGYQMYIVVSGSMNPAFDTGSMVFVKPVNPDEIKEREIITYRGLGDGRQLVSHRVVSISDTEDGITFTTKGDANDVPDPNPVPTRNLVGKVVLAVPYLGYFMDFSKTKRGTLILVVIPAAILLVYELGNLYKNMTAIKREKAVQCESQKDVEV